MIIIDEHKYLEKQLEDRGIGIFDFYDDRQVMTLSAFCKLPLQRRASLLLVDTQTVVNHPELLENFKSLVNTFIGVIFFQQHSNEEALKWVQNELPIMTKVIGEYSLPMSDLSWTIFFNQLHFFTALIEDQHKLQRNMLELSLELDQVLQNAESEVKKVKKIHEVLMPKRQDEIKGVYFLNKYAAGDGGGGEFYDLHQSNNKVFQILISSQSYLISSALLGILSQHKQGSFDPIKFLEDAAGEVETINSAKKKKANVDILLLELDLATLTLKNWNKSKAELYSQVKGQVVLEKDGHYQLARGEKLIVFSSGFIFNWNEGRDKQDFNNFFKDHQHLDQQELLSELFFKLRHEVKKDFLSSDATVAMMEVKRHGMHKI